MPEIDSAPFENDPPPDPNHKFALVFARAAAHQGWSLATFHLFCDEQGLSAADRLKRWPKGPRTLGRQLNAYADAQTMAAFVDGGPAPLSTVIMRRFADNAELKPAVRSLALSDAAHPVDTLIRTAATAALFWRCQDRPLSRSGIWARLRICLLVVLYSACVLVWFADTTPDQRRLRTAIRMSATALGAS